MTKTITPTEINNLVNPFLVAKYYQILQEKPQTYAKKRWYYKNQGKTDHYIALGVAQALLNSQED
jgi:hypothetical protein